MEYIMEPTRTMPIDTRTYGTRTPFAFGPGEAAGVVVCGSLGAFRLTRGFGFEAKAGLDGDLLGGFGCEAKAGLDGDFLGGFGFEGKAGLDGGFPEGL